jgi:23S rRNA pseudouridine1911/1915/1917 synthase
MSAEVIVTSKEESAFRLDKLLSLRFPNHSRSYFEFLIDSGCVLVNGSRIKKREKTEEGDEVEVCFLATPELSFEPENIPLNILYEDDEILAINKPPGLVVHPAAGHYQGTFLNALLYHCKNLRVEPNLSPAHLRPGIVHRLDKDTSGVLIAAKTMEMHQKLVSLFQSRQIEKLYLAVCLGNPGNITIDAPLKRHPIHRKEMVTCLEGGKNAVSECTVIAQAGELSLVQVKIITGRTHQIRAHFKHINCPIIGDPVYGSSAINQKFGAHRQLLHAASLQLKHPTSAALLKIEAPTPSDFSSFLRKHLNFHSI